MSPSKKSSKDSKKQDTSDDAVVESASTENKESPSTSSESSATSVDAPLVIDAEVVEEPESEPSDPEISKDTGIPDPQPQPPEPVQSRSGFFPMLAGGVIAGAIGFLIATYAPFNQESENSTAEAVQANFDNLSALSARVDDLAAEEPVDLAEVNKQLAALNDGVVGVSDQVQSALTGTDSALSTLEEKLSSLDARLRTLEEQPERGDGSTARAAAAQEELKAFRAELDQLINDAEARVAESEAKAAEIDLAAKTAAADAMRRADFAKLRAAIESGSGFAEMLAAFDDVPAALTDAATNGVPTMVSLQTGFPDAARAALATVQTVPEDATAGQRLTAFLKRQTNARSLAPREGDDADAVLSRAEARLNEGSLDAALAELAALPDAATSAMSDWLEKARLRTAALAAAEQFSLVTN